MSKIQCPYCGCTPEFGFDCVDHVEEGDDHVMDSYQCPKCGKFSIRCYVFQEWQDENGDKVVVNYDNKRNRKKPVPKNG